MFLRGDTNAKFKYFEAKFTPKCGANLTKNHTYPHGKFKQDEQKTRPNLTPKSGG
ncbi:hypothetical protein [Campylobacter showae]|uniref:Uncharacterized protein n=1 Tax=Campylobacter showae CSUNSWCD TaxID=1244083 RepID=M5IPX4_9BACT|nr:hypothetical protein [Campylobacter showae]EKU10218.1 hypothetical protein CSUNSWCD_1092 [Campylobacter showae CSUNSWCD]